MEAAWKRSSNEVLWDEYREFEFSKWNQGSYEEGVMAPFINRQIAYIREGCATRGEVVESHSDNVPFAVAVVSPTREMYSTRLRLVEGSYYPP